MILTLIISILTILCLILSIIYKPTIKLFGRMFQTYWIAALIGALCLVCFKSIKLIDVKEIVFSKGKMNPIQILVLFISMSSLSIVLDEAGFFKRCAYLATRIKKSNQIVLFLSISFVVSLLTVFTSNDIVILTFTPFICYFAKRSKINPIPYLIGEFVFANTWSMLLMIGNPTNIFLSSSFSIDFLTYLKIMVVPTLVSGLVSVGLIILIFKKELKKPLMIDESFEKPICNMFVTIVGLIHLIGCTIMLVISSYIEIQIWLICLGFASVEMIILLFYYIIKKKPIVFNVLVRLPWSLVPFVLSMFIIVGSLEKNDIISIIGNNLNSISGKGETIFSYGFLAFISSNILNNIPMSVMFEKIISVTNDVFMKEKIFSTIIASNVGAYLTPIGALAGIMWMSILSNMKVKFSFKDFLKYGVVISSVILLVSLTVLYFVL